MSFKLLGNKATDIDLFKDPFDKDKIENIWISIRKTWEGDISYTGTISFENGDTSGEQKITGSSFEELIKNIENFINSL